MAERPKKMKGARTSVIGEPWVWLSGGAVATGIVMIIGMLALMLVEGTTAFWPHDIDAFVMGKARYNIRHPEQGPVFISADDKQLVVPAQGDSWLLADGRAPASQPASTQPATLALFRTNAKPFDGRDWVLRRPDGQLMLDLKGQAVTPTQLLAEPTKYLGDKERAELDQQAGRWRIEDPRHGQAHLTPAGELVFPVAWRGLDGKPMPFEFTTPRRASIADYREFPGLFEGVEWLLSDLNDSVVSDAEGKPVTAARYLASPAEFPSPWGYLDEHGKQVPIETLLGDDRWRDFTVLVGTPRGERSMDIRILPPNPDGTPVKPYQVAGTPTEILVRQGNQGEGLYGDASYFRWVRTELPEPEAMKRHNLDGYNEVVLNRLPLPGAVLIERLEKGVLSGYVTKVSNSYEELVYRGEDGAWLNLSDEKVATVGAAPVALTVENLRLRPKLRKTYNKAALRPRDLDAKDGVQVTIRDENGNEPTVEQLLNRPQDLRRAIEEHGNQILTQLEVVHVTKGQVFLARVEEVHAEIGRDGMEKTWEVFQAEHERMRELYLERYDIEKNALGRVNFELKDREDALKRIRYENRDSRHVFTAMEALVEAHQTWQSAEPLPDPAISEEEYQQKLDDWLETLGPILETWLEEAAKLELNEQELDALQRARQIEEQRAEIQALEFGALRFKVVRMRAAEEGATYEFRTSDQRSATLHLSEVVRAFRPNEAGAFGKVGVYLGRVWEFLTDDPRESNTEGGIWPVILGTLIMTMLMCVAVVPFGVIAALYLREYAKQGPIVSAVRIAVNNLAGVPSIVFGIFGLGFFCVVVGGSIDDLFFPELQPAPVFGGGGILWASLTLALLTVPVVIVSTEEALSAVPSSQREASLACGASKWQTIVKVILPQALPGVLTGTILAMARGAGEVAPLMLVGAVKYAPYPPIDGIPPFVHLERKFMHLGFHIYDVGFQSPNVDNTKPLVFATALVLIVMVAVLNIFAIRLRNRLRRKYATSAV